MFRGRRVVVVGAGISGLVTALLLAARGLNVVVVERMGAPGGKMREVDVGGRKIDAGPTVFTMRWVFEEIFADAGLALGDHVGLQQVDVLARHAWSDGSMIDLFADQDRTVDAIAAFAGPAEAARYREFCSRAHRMFATLDEPFIRAVRPNMWSLIRRTDFRNLWQISPFTTLWRALGTHFHDPRLRQLFGRYATYCGSSPYASPATLMLVAHVERVGVWLVEGGMHRLAAALADVAARTGAEFRYAEDAREVLVESGKAAGVVLASGERVESDAVVVTADAAAIASGRFGNGVSAAVPTVPKAARSLSAVTWNLLAEPTGFPLIRHSVFFSADYRTEFGDIFRRRQVPTAPTVYICAQDRGDSPISSHAGPERLLCLVNAPPTGDVRPFQQEEIERCTTAMLETLRSCGLTMDIRPECSRTTTPTDFNRLFPATGGALYGPASHGWRASFRRSGCRSRIPGLYVAGGSVHPGPGVPMAALSGRAAATALLADFGST